MNAPLQDEIAVAVPALQMREIIELLRVVALGQENASHQGQARILANALGNRLRDAQGRKR